MHRMDHDPHPAGRLASAGLFAALTFLATYVIKIPTPAFGYIHLGDGFVLLAGLLLGPVGGGLAAGIGSAAADLLGGYAAWVPGTFLVKFLTAAAAGQLQFVLQHTLAHRHGRRIPSPANRPHALRTLHLLMTGLPAELLMTAGYFCYTTLFLIATGSGQISLTAAAVSAAAELPFNLVQGAAGIVLTLLLYPVFHRLTSRYNSSVRS